MGVVTQLVKDWRDLMKYKELIPAYSASNEFKFEEMMDTMQELYPIDEFQGASNMPGDRIGILAGWISACVGKGLINEGEKIELQHYLINGYGGI